MTDAAARHAPDNSPVGRNFVRSERLHEMLAYPAHLYRLDVMFGKFSVMFGKTIVSAWAYLETRWGMSLGHLLREAD